MYSALIRCSAAPLRRIATYVESVKEIRIADARAIMNTIMMRAMPRERDVLSRRLAGARLGDVGGP
jgi:hypothetical protein